MTELILDTFGSALVIRLNNPKRLNVLDFDVLASLEQTIDEAERNAALRGVVLTGAGERAFCAGADISCWGNMKPYEFARDWVRKGHRVFDRLAGLAKPTVAALNGLTLGGGLELAAACDLRIAARHVEIGLPEARVGVVPGWSGTQRLARLLPGPVIKEMAVFGRRLSAERAVTLGFVAETAADPVQTAIELVNSLSQLSPLSVETAKLSINAGAGEQAASSLDALSGAAILGTEDCAEGISAFRQKRSAEFRGR